MHRDFQPHDWHCLKTSDSPPLPDYASIHDADLQIVGLKEKNNLIQVKSCSWFFFQSNLQSTQTHDFTLDDESQYK